ncbi:MAG: hypothetical protein HKP58_17395 [Desulfatitalea sp.]|nr:hypothetical protein [Desulfatitalea sp.]NNK02189.1 hypothetical protein [Desulfatitalea sp.]
MNKRVCAVIGLLCSLFILLPAATAGATDADGDRGINLSKLDPDARNKPPKTKADADVNGDGAKTLSGMSILGNDEAPKSLYIVPWQSSEIGVEITLNTSLNEAAVPVDRDVFMRQLAFYRVSRGER